MCVFFKTLFPHLQKQRVAAVVGFQFHVTMFPVTCAQWLSIPCCFRYDLKPPRVEMGQPHCAQNFRTRHAVFALHRGSPQNRTNGADSVCFGPEKGTSFSVLLSWRKRGFLPVLHTMASSVLAVTPAIPSQNLTLFLFLNPQSPHVLSNFSLHPVMARLPFGRDRDQV